MNQVLVELLRRIEVETGRRITELFDVVCGTSTGGLVAVALLLGKSLDQVSRNLSQSLCHLESRSTR